MLRTTTRYAYSEPTYCSRLEVPAGEVVAIYRRSSLGVYVLDEQAPLADFFPLSSQSGHRTLVGSIHLFWIVDYR